MQILLKKTHWPYLTGKIFEILRGNVIGACNSQLHGPIQFEDFFQSHKGLCYTKGIHRKGGTVRAAWSLMSLKKYLNSIGPCDWLFQESITSPRKISRTFHEFTSRIRPLPPKFNLTLLHSERPKSYTILAFLRAVSLKFMPWSLVSTGMPRDWADG